MSLTAVDKDAVRLPKAVGGGQPGWDAHAFARWKEEDRPMPPLIPPWKAVHT